MVAGAEIRPRLSAYVLAADPAYLAASVASYYDAVDQIVVSYDERHVSWSGYTIPVEQCLQELASVDTEGKLVYVAGAYSDPHQHPLVCETIQRQHALDVAAEGSDWVLQLDGDEVVPDLPAFLETIAAAAASGYDGLDYPARWIYGRAANGRWLELSSRVWGVVANYPGPLAVRSGASLHHARQIDGELYRVDFRSKNTDPFRPPDLRVDATVPPAAGVLHFSWARTEADLREKAVVSGHRDDFDWDGAIAKWLWHQRHPRLAVLGTPLRRRGSLGTRGWLRTTALPIDPDRLTVP
jgi:hypothetical protein